MVRPASLESPNSKAVVLLWGISTSVSSSAEEERGRNSRVLAIVVDFLSLFQAEMDMVPTWRFNNSTSEKSVGYSR